LRFNIRAVFYEVSKEDEYLFKGKRKRLVEQLKTKGIKNEKVLAAIEKVPRHLFFDHNTARPALLDHAYSDKALPIGAGQTISHPYTVAFQTEQLDIKPGEKVLEIGTGCGYQTAVLIEVGAKVYSIERQKTLFDKTRVFLPHIGYSGARLIYEMIWLKKNSATGFDKKTLGSFKFVPLLQNKSGS
ncbi:MAG: protein-L-isoaspartate O-methyltransferase, partial [Bacteroidetes bacterium]|nr:protein-L-isoaspartate O-methyltransferase [Bacteroidota bacterium]